MNMNPGRDDERAAQDHVPILQRELTKKDETIERLKQKLEDKNKPKEPSKVIAWAKNRKTALWDLGWRHKKKFWLLLIIVFSIYLFEPNNVYEAQGVIIDIKQETVTKEVENCENTLTQNKSGKLYRRKICKTAKTSSPVDPVYTIQYKDYRGNTRQESFTTKENIHWASNKKIDLVGEKIDKTICSCDDSCLSPSILVFLDRYYDLLKKGQKVRVFYLTGSIFGDHSWFDSIIDARKATQKSYEKPKGPND